MSVRGRGSLHTQLLIVLRSDADKEDSTFRNIRNRRWPERKGERPKNHDSQPDVLDLLPPPSLNLQRTSTLQLEVTACEKLFAGIIWILGWRYLSPERIFISICQAPWGTTNLGPLLIHIQDLRFKTKRVTQTGLKILGYGGVCESFPVHCYPEGITLWGIYVKRVKGNLSRIPFHSHSGQSLGFDYGAPCATRPPRLSWILTNVTSGSANVLTSAQWLPGLSLILA